MNLHAIASRAISCLHPNVSLILVRALGSENDHGMLKGTFGQCEEITAQMQTLSGDELKLDHEIYEVDIVRKFYLSVQGRPVLAGMRLLEAGSDFLYLKGIRQFWRVHAVSEDYNLSGWAQVNASLQDQPPAAVVIALIKSDLVDGDEVKWLVQTYLEARQDDQGPQPEPRSGSGSQSGADDRGRTATSAVGNGGGDHTAGGSGAIGTGGAGYARAPAISSDSTDDANRAGSATDNSGADSSRFFGY